MPRLKATGVSEEKTKHRSTFDLMSALLYWQGLYPEDRDLDLEYLTPRLGRRHRLLRQTLRYFRHSYPRVMLTLMGVLCFAVHPGGIYVHWLSQRDCIDNIYASSIWLTAFLALLVFMLKKTQLKEIALKIEGLLRDENLDNDHQKELVEKWNRRLYYFTMATHISVQSFVTIVVPVYKWVKYYPERRLYTRSWYPYNETSFPAFEITLAISCLHIIATFLLCNTIFTTGATIFVSLRILFKIIANKFANIREIAIGRIVKRKREEIKRRVGMGRCDVGNVETVVDVDRLHNSSQSRGNDLTLQRSLTDGPVTWMEVTRNLVCHIWEDAVGYTEEDVDRETKVLVKMFLQFHQELFVLKDMIDSIFTLLFLIVSGLNVVIYGVTLIVISTHEELTVQEIVVLLTTFEVVLVFLIANYMCDLITDEAESVSTAIYSSDWYNASPSFKSSMLIITARVNMPLDFKPIGLDPLSLHNFAEMSNLAYKSTATLNNMLAR